LVYGNPYYFWNIYQLQKEKGSISNTLGRYKNVKIVKKAKIKLFGWSVFLEIIVDRTFFLFAIDR
jgi:hypothetical protein